MFRRLKSRMVIRAIIDDPVLWYDVAEIIHEDCPFYDDCVEQAFENYEPDHNEGYD